MIWPAAWLPPNMLLVLSCGAGLAAVCSGHTDAFLLPAAGAGSADTAPEDTPHSIALDKHMQAALDSGDPSTQQFFTALALCNTVVPTATEQGELLYQVGGWGGGCAAGTRVQLWCQGHGTFATLCSTRTGPLPSFHSSCVPPPCSCLTRPRCPAPARPPAPTRRPLCRVPPT